MDFNDFSAFGDADYSNQSVQQPDPMAMQQQMMMQQQMAMQQEMLMHQQDMLQAQYYQNAQVTQAQLQNMGYSINAENWFKANESAYEEAIRGYVQGYTQSVVSVYKMGAEFPERIRHICPGSGIVKLDKQGFQIPWANAVIPFFFCSQCGYLIIPANIKRDYLGI